MLVNGPWQKSGDSPGSVQRHHHRLSLSSTPRPPTCILSHPHTYISSSLPLSSSLRSPFSPCYLTFHSISTIVKAFFLLELALQSPSPPILTRLTSPPTSGTHPLRLASSNVWHQSIISTKAIRTNPIERKKGPIRPRLRYLRRN